MEHRIKSYLNSREIPNTLKNTSLSVSGDLDSFFEGPQTFPVLLREALERARQQGVKEAIDKISAGITENLKKHISEVIRTVSLVDSVVKKTLPNLEIKAYRSKFCFDLGWINVFFVINSSVEDEISFSNLLNGVEQVILKEDNFIIETLFVNERDKEVDYSAIKNDYPFTIKPVDLEKK